MSQGPAPTIDDLVAAGSNQYVSRRLARGESWDTIRAQLKEEFPQAHPNTVQAALVRGQASWDAAQTLDVVTPNITTPTWELPSRTAGLHGWRYTVLATIRDAATGAIRHRYITEYGSMPATRDDLEALVEHTINTTFPRPQRPGYRDQVSAGSTLVSMEIISIERG